MNDFARFDETSLPPPSEFYSKLSNEHITDSAYKHAQEVWDTFNCRNIGDYHDLYLRTDVFLLADVFENFTRRSRPSVSKVISQPRSLGRRRPVDRAAGAALRLIDLTPQLTMFFFFFFFFF